MKLVGLLSWYLERPSWLSACIASYHQAGITHLVAIDGAYALYPDGEPRSTPAEHEAIVEICKSLNIHLNLILPSTVWHGNEVEKRTALFRAAELVADEDTDWYVVMDADEIVTRAYDGWLERLDSATHGDGERYLAADVMLWERDNIDTPERAQVARRFSYDPRTAVPIRKVFRAIRGLHCHGNHYNYRTPNGESLWSHRPTVPGLDITSDVVIEHRNLYRSKHRSDRSKEYYQRRDYAGIEKIVVD